MLGVQIAQPVLLIIKRLMEHRHVLVPALMDTIQMRVLAQVLKLTSLCVFSL